MAYSGHETPARVRAPVRGSFGLCNRRVGRGAASRSGLRTWSARGIAATEHPQGPLPATGLLSDLVPRQAAGPSASAWSLRTVAAPGAAWRLSHPGLISGTTQRDRQEGRGRPLAV